MAMVPERSKPLHNFSMPCLKWGTQRFLRCVKLTANAAEPSSLDRRSSRLQSKLYEPQMKQIAPSHVSKRKSNDNINNIDAVREKLMEDLRVAAKKLKVSIFEEGNDAAANARPWNLRARRASCKVTPPHEEEGKGKFDLGEEGVVAKENVFSEGKINERAKFSVSLSKEEVERDFLALVGTRPHRRPKKRPRIVQRGLDTLFPGLWLTEVTPESYKVPDVPE